MNENRPRPSSPPAGGGHAGQDDGDGLDEEESDPILPVSTPGGLRWGGYALLVVWAVWTVGVVPAGGPFSHWVPSRDAVAVLFCLGGCAFLSFSVWLLAYPEHAVQNTPRYAENPDTVLGAYVHGLLLGVAAVCFYIGIVGWL